MTMSVNERVTSLPLQLQPNSKFSFFAVKLIVCADIAAGCRRKPKTVPY